MREASTINLVTPTVIKKAYKEAQEGVSIPLQWHTGAFEHLIFDRGCEFHANENPVSHKSGDFDSGIPTPPSWADLCRSHYESSAASRTPSRLSFDELSKYTDRAKPLSASTSSGTSSNLIARGVLVDFKRWADTQGRSFNARGDDAISITEIEAAMKAQGTEILTGDVLIIRSGFVKSISGLHSAEQAGFLLKSGSCGVENNMRAVEWCRDRGLSAVAGDMLGFERIPSASNGVSRVGDDTAESIEPCVLHDSLMRRLGMPFGELWDLEALSKTCVRLKRYTFLLTCSLSSEAHGETRAISNGLAIL